MASREVDSNIIDFVQTSKNSKVFRPAYCVSEELREEMVSKVFKDFMIYTLDRYYEENESLFEETVVDLEVRKEKGDSLKHNLFWWRVFYDSNQYGNSIIEDYIADNYHWLSKKPILISWLRECDKVVPKFYFIGHKYNENFFVAIDILAEETLDVIVYDPTAIPPITGELAFGTLIPLGGGLFFPIIDLYHFDYEARQDIANHLHFYFDKHLKKSPMHEAFIHVLLAMLQIETFVFRKSQGVTTL